MEVIICPDYDSMSAQAAAAVAEVVRKKPDAVLGLATGSTPLGLYKELIRLHREDGLDFSDVTTFNLDEYVGLGPDHEQSYSYFMRENLFKHINVPPERTHVPSGTADDYREYCAAYEQQIRDCGGIDIQVLGIGSDGHIAFNEPGSSLASRTRIKTLAEPTINDNARFFSSKDEVPIYAVTMGVGTIMESRRTILLANGPKKADALAAAVEGPVSSFCTASALQMHPHAAVFTDAEAAGKLRMSDYYRWVQKNKPNAPAC
ncbi:MAG: glucosamine-6-phosphate deaminase [Phycisphaerae bacterium]